MVVNNQQMMNGVQQPMTGEDIDRPIDIGEMDFEFISKGDPAVDIQDAAIRLKENLEPEELQELISLQPQVERFYILMYKGETGEYPPEPMLDSEQGKGITVDEYRSMSDEDKVSNSMDVMQKLVPTKKSMFDNSPDQFTQLKAPEKTQMEQPPVEQEEMQEGGEVLPEQEKTKGKIPAGPVGEVDVSGKDESGVADDVQTKSDGFVLSKGAVIANGKMYIMDLINDAISSLEEKGKTVDTKDIPENAEDILVSNGEILIPDIIAQEIGYKRLEKMNKRGEELTEKLIAEYEQQQGQQQQAQLVPGFQDGGNLTEKQVEDRDNILKDLGERRDMQEQVEAVDIENQMQGAMPEPKKPEISKAEPTNVEVSRVDSTPKTVSVEAVPFSEVDFETFKIGYKGHNPTVKTIRDVKWKTNVLNQFKTIKPTAQITNTINSVLPAFKELERHNLYNRDFFEKLAIVESNSGDPNQMVSDTNDYGVFQINIDAIGRTFNDEGSFNNSFKKYYSDKAAQVTGYSADKLKELYNSNIEEFKDLLIKNPKLNLALAIAGSIMPNLDSGKNIQLAKKNV